MYNERLKIRFLKEEFSDDEERYEFFTKVFETFAPYEQEIDEDRAHPDGAPVAAADVTLFDMVGSIGTLLVVVAAHQKLPFNLHTTHYDTIMME